METPPRLLLVEDDTELLKELLPFLRREGYAVDFARDGETALNQILSDHPDLVILDVGLPKIDGREVLRRLRRAGNQTPIIFLSQYGESEERALALHQGADDYLNKPYGRSELIARITAVLRRARPDQLSLEAAQILISGELRLDLGARRAFLRTQDLGLSQKAISLLADLMTHPGKVLTRERLLKKNWGDDYDVSDRTVDKYISELRTALRDNRTKPRYIETVSEQGYRFMGTVEAKP
jgi:DNA-binding response OmpR family regulator